MLKEVLDLQATQGEVIQIFMTTQVAHAQLLGHTCGRLGFFARVDFHELRRSLFPTPPPVSTTSRSSFVHSILEIMQSLMTT